MDKMDFSYSTPAHLELLLGLHHEFLWIFVATPQKYIQKNRNKKYLLQNLRWFQVRNLPTKHRPPTKEEPYQYTPTTWSWKLGQRGHEEDLGEVKMKKKMCKMECCWIILLNNSLMYQTSSFFCSIEFLSIADFRVGYPPLWEDRNNVHFAQVASVSSQRRPYSVACFTSVEMGELSNLSWFKIILSKNWI